MSTVLLERIRAAGFEPLGWFCPADEDALPAAVRCVVLIGNAGPEMFARFVRERTGERDTLDAWTRRVIDPLAGALDARAVYPFERPWPPIQAWARKAGAGFASPLGLNIHPRFGLWHAFRAALLFERDLGLPVPAVHQHPCEQCAERPCLHACPVQAFSAAGYDTAACGGWLRAPGGADCLALGCRARRACPVGREYAYAPEQAAFHMRAFADSLDPGAIGEDTGRA